MKRLNNKKGFTLIELIIVIAILAILALILIPALQRYLLEANVKRDITNARQLYTEVVLTYAGGGELDPQEVSGVGNLECTFTGDPDTRVVSDFQCSSTAFDAYEAADRWGDDPAWDGEFYSIIESDIGE